MLVEVVKDGGVIAGPSPVFEFIGSFWTALGG
jgi:hypothetical protein